MSDGTPVREAARGGLLALDADGRIVSIDEAVGRALGIDPDEAAGIPVDRLFDPVGDRDGRRVVDDLDGTGRTVPVEYADAGGRTRAGELRVVPVDLSGADVAAVVRDASDRRERERMVASLHEVTRWLVRATEREEVCSIAVHAASDLLDLPISGVWLLDDERGRLEPVAATAEAHDEFGGLPRFTRGEGVVWDAFEAGEIARYDDLRDVEGLYNPGTELRSELIAPIGTHGVLMTGSFEPRRFDGTDVDLLSTLVANARAALDRADRERVLRERTERLERQTERLETVAATLSEDVKRLLGSVGDALGESTADGRDDPTADRDRADVAETLERVDRLIDDLGELARNAGTDGPRSRVTLEGAIDDALVPAGVEVVLEEDATLRAAPDRFGRLLERTIAEVASRSDGTIVRVGTFGLAADEGPRGFYLFDDAGATDAAADAGGADGLGLAVARAIASAHGWSVAVDDDAARVEVRGVTTLERA